MASPWFGEFMGTLILILLGDGVCANVLLKRSKAEGAGWLVVATGWGLAVFAGVFTAIACGSPDAHVNPAITLAVAIRTGDFASCCLTQARSCSARSPARRWCGCTSGRIGK